MPRWLRRSLIVLAGLAAVVLVALAATAGYASRLVSKKWEVPTPPIQAATDPELVARGERIFLSSCYLCHADEKGRVSGQHMADVPQWLGTFHTANITAHAEAGIGGWSDGDLARAIRFGVRPDGRSILIMPQFKGMSDEDLAAVIGFMRSGEPMFAPVDVKRPAPAPSVRGKAILALVVGFDPSGKAEGVGAPPPGPTAEYGRYLVDNVVDCGGCHTAGFSPKKLQGAEAFAGGFEFVSADGQPVLSANITPDEKTGIGSWTQEQFFRAVRHGVRPDGTTLRPPMPMYRALSDDELTAIWLRLRELAPVAKAIPRAPEGAAPAGDDPPALFVKHGCVACHGEGRPFRAKLRQAIYHDVDGVAARILRPQDFSRSAQMPSFEGRIDPETAKALAAWVKEQAATIPAK